MFDKCAGDEHGRIEIFVRTTILLGEFVIFPFPENRQQGGNAHGKQTVTEDDAARSVFTFHNGAVQYFGELTGMFLPLLSGEGDLCGKIQQMQMHLKQLFSQLAIVGTQVGLALHGSACFPYPFRLTGVDDETAVESVFKRGEEENELLLRTREVERQSGQANKYRITVYFVGRRNLFVMECLAKDVGILAIVLSDGRG